MLILEFKAAEAPAEKKVEEVKTEEHQQKALEHSKELWPPGATVYKYATPEDAEILDKAAVEPTEENSNKALEVVKKAYKQMSAEEQRQLRVDLKLPPLKAKTPIIKESVITETAEKFIKTHQYKVTGHIKFQEEADTMEKTNPEGADTVRDLAEKFMEISSKEESDKFLQEQKDRFIEMGMTDIAASIGEVQETVRNKWDEINAWTAEHTVSQLVPLVVAQVGEYAKELMSNITEFVGDYKSKIEDIKGIDEETRAEIMAEAEQAKKSEEELEAAKKDNKLDEIFEKNLKQEMELVKSTITDAEVLSQISQLENAGSVKITSEQLMLKNMYPSVIHGTIRAYRKAVDERRGLE